MGQHMVLPVRCGIADPVIRNQIILLVWLEPRWSGFQAFSPSLLLLPLCLLFLPFIMAHRGTLPRALLGDLWQPISQLRALQEQHCAPPKLHPLK